MRRPPLAAADLVPAAALLLLAEGEALWGGYDRPGVLAAGGAAIAVALLFRRRAPLLSIAGLLAALTLVTALGATTNTVTVIVAYIVWCYSLGAHADDRPAFAGLLVLLVSSWIAIALGRPDVGPGDFVFVAILFGGAAGVGRAMRERAARASRWQRRAGLAEEERERRAEEAVRVERARIARELHDVVAHSMSVMVMQTAVVRRRLADDDPEDSSLLAEVERTGREALGEMRRLLGLLRTDDDGPALAPQPGTDRLDALVEQVREAGLPVEMRVSGTRYPLPAGLDLVAYRVVQEGLTNALKHAAGAATCVLLHYDPDGLDIEVSDHGPGTPAPGVDGSDGHGLVGMRERVTLYGGTLEAGPAPAGGFRVHARLPVEQPA